MRKTGTSLDEVVIGGGISGLGLAWSLSRRGRPCTLLEAGPGPGGLAGPLRLAGHAVERYYHYSCPADTALQALCGELDISLRQRAATQAVWAQGWRPLNGALQLAAFPLAWGAKLRLAWGALGLGGAEPGLALDGEEARDWLRGRFGNAAAEALFLPLVQGKFGDAPLSAAWMRHRLWRSRRGSRAGLPQAGYPEGGYGALFNALTRALRERGCDLRFKSPLLGLRRAAGAWELRLSGGRKLRARRVLAAVPAPRLRPILPAALRDGAWGRALDRLRWRALVQPVFALRRPVSPYFWNNLPAAFTPFNGLVQGEQLRPLPFHLAYLPAYVDAADPLTRAGDRAVLARAWELLRRLEPRLSAGDRLDAAVCREALAQPLLPPDSAARLPSPHAPAPGLYWLDACHLYPADRSLDACLRAAESLIAELPHA